MSDKIFRYSPVRFGQLEVDANGAFVFYADVAPLEDRIEELRKELNVVARNSHSIIAEQAAEIERLKGGIEWMADCVIRERGGTDDPQGWIQMGLKNADVTKQKITSQAAEIERLKNKPTYRMRQEQKDNYCELIEELEQRIAKQADELKIAEQGRIALRSKIAEQAAEIERLKVANEAWHRRVRELQRIEELEARMKTSAPRRTSVRG